jgi:hypothetical protein
MSETTRRRTFLGLVVAAAALAALVSFVSDAPSKSADYALGSAAVWHFEVALATFLPMYFVLVTLLLAERGMAFTRFAAGPASAEAESIAAEETNKAVAELGDQVRELTELVDDLGKRLDALEH